MAHERKVFTVEIELGNDAMQTGADIAQALERVIAQVREHEKPEPFHSLRIRDLNGNQVGGWNIAYERVED